MAANGPALDQRVVVYQGAPALYTVPIADPDGTRPDVTGSTAAWFVGPLPVRRGAGGCASVADAPGAFTKALTVAADPAVPGAFLVVLAIEPEDLVAFAPGGVWQHEIWLTPPNGRPSPITFGPLVIHGTVGGAA